MLVKKVKNDLKFLTNVMKKGNQLIISFNLFGLLIKIYKKTTFKLISKNCKKMARDLGYKNPEIYIYNNAKDSDNSDISNLCWAVYVKEA